MANPQTMKLYISFRNAKGQMQTIDPANPPSEAPADILAAAEAVRAAQAPKRGRGRPVGYKCSPETVAAMLAQRAVTIAKRKARSA